MKRTAVLTIVALGATTAIGQKATQLNANFSDLVAGKSINVKVASAPNTVGMQIHTTSPNLPSPNGQGVPEPATMATLAVGAAALLRRKRKTA